MIRVALLLAFVTACYQPSFEQLACGPGDVCPAGLRCELGLCVDDELASDAAILDAGAVLDAPIDDDATPIVDDAMGHDAPSPPIDAPPPPIDAPLPPIDAPLPPIDAPAPPIDAPPPPIDAPPAICGNGIPEPGEACDDGNTVTEVACGYGEPTCQGCDATCTAVVDLTGPYCGDGTTQSPEEECDGGGPFAVAPCCDHCINVCW